METNGVTNNDGIEYYSTQCVSKLKSNKAETHSENEKSYFFTFSHAKIQFFVHFHPVLNTDIRILQSFRHFSTTLRHFWSIFETFWGKNVHEYQFWHFSLEK